MLANYASAESHHGGGRPSVWCKAEAANHAAMVALDPDRFFVPPYVGPKGWLGVYLDGDVDWKELAGLLRDAWRRTAPKRLAALHADP
jgi:hypothetical protein